MEIVICKTKKEASRKAADMIAKLVKENPKCVLGLATGSTPAAAPHGGLSYYALPL